MFRHGSNFNNDIIWSLKLWCNALDNSFDHIQFIFEDVVLNECIDEYLTHYFIFQTWRKHINEFICFTLAILQVLCQHHVLSYILLKITWNSHVLHRGIGLINLFLKLLSLSIQRRKNTRQGSKDISINQSSTYQMNNASNNKQIVNWCNIISSELKHCIIKSYCILNFPVLFMQQRVFRQIHVLLVQLPLVWAPFLISVTVCHIPHTTSNMNV